MKKVIAIALSVVVVGAAGIGIYAGVHNSKEVSTEVVEVSVEEVPLTESIEDTKAEETKTEETKTDETSTEETEQSNETTEETEVEETELAEAEEAVDEYVDNYYTVTPNKNGQLVNGDFTNGLSDFEVYGFEQENIDYSTSKTEGFKMIIKDTGSEDWHVQLKQTGIRLEKDRWYKLTFDAKSTLERDIICTLQRNGLYDDDWTPYSESAKCALGSEWKTYTLQFKMAYDTDEDVVFNLSMGTINGNRITKKHYVSVNHIKLEALEDNWTDSLRSDDNLLGNTLFAYNGMLWETSVVAPGEANTYFENGGVVFDITNPGTLDWHIQLKQQEVKLKKDQGYLFTCAVESSVARTIKVGFMDTDYVDWYGGADIELQAGINVINVPFMNTIRDNDNCVMMISMGQIEGVATPAGKLIIHSLSLVEKDDVQVPVVAAKQVEVKTIFDLDWGFYVYDHEGTHTGSIYVDEGNGFRIQILDTGTEDWHVQLQKKYYTLEKGKWYRIYFDAKSTTNRSIFCTMQRDGSEDDDWRAYSMTDGEQRACLTNEWSSYEQIFQMTQDTDNRVIFNFSLGTVYNDRIKESHSVWINHIVFEEVEAPKPPAAQETPLGAQMLNNPSFANNGTGWDTVINEDANASVLFEDGKAVFDIKNPGKEDWNVQLAHKGLSFEKGYQYRMTFNASSTETRDIKVGFMQDQTFDWFGGADITLQAVNANARTGETAYAVEFVMEKESVGNGMMAISMGKIAGKDTPASVITISDVKLVKMEVKDGPTVDDDGQIVIKSTDEKNTDDNSEKWLVKIDDPTKYNADVKVGDTIKVTAKLYSEKAYQAMLGACYTESWAWIDTGVVDIEGGTDYELTLTVEDYKGALQLQIPSMEGDEVIVKEIKIEIVVDEKPAEDEPVYTFTEENKGSDVWKYQVAVADFSEEENLAGKKVKVTAVLTSDGGFCGAIGGNNFKTTPEEEETDWSQCETIDAVANEDNTWEYVFENFAGPVEIQVYWMEKESVTIKSVKVEVVADELKENALFVVNSTDEKNTENGSEKWVVNLTPTNYNEAVKEGDKIKVTAKLYSEKAFKAMLGSCYTESWAWVDTGVQDMAGGEDNELTLTVEDYKGALQLQIPSMEGEEVFVKEIKVEILEKDSQPINNDAIILSLFAETEAEEEGLDLQEEDIFVEETEEESEEESEEETEEESEEESEEETEEESEEKTEEETEEEIEEETEEESEEETQDEE